MADTVKDIKTQIADLQKKLIDLNGQKHSGTLKDTTQMGKTKKEIARLMTKLTQMQSGA